MITWNFTAASYTQKPRQLKLSAFPFLLDHKKVAKPAIIIAEAEMAQVKITVKKNGPYRVEAPEGTIELVDSDGNKYDLTGKPAFSLCRCGASVTKPFCDGTHTRIGFQAAEAAVRAEQQQGNPISNPPAGSPAKG